jgi:hypothetical protein
MIVDNGSKDESVDAIKKYARAQIKVESKLLEPLRVDRHNIDVWELTKAESELGDKLGENFERLPPNRKMLILKNDKNYGFAEGCNIGIRYASKILAPDYILLLNNDTVVKSDFLEELINAIDNDEGIGFAGPMIYYYEMDGRRDIISVAGIELNMTKGTYHRLGALEVDEGQFKVVRTVDYLEGSCILIRREVLEKVGMLNPRYFAYWEEADLCIRGLRAGYRSVFVPSSKIWHKVSSSADSSVKLYYMTRNRLWFMRTHATKGQLLHFMIYFFAFQFWKTLAWFTMQKDAKKIVSFLRGAADGAIWSERF